VNRAAGAAVERTRPASRGCTQEKLMARFNARTMTIAGALAALFAGSAHAGAVAWSVGIHAPIAPGVAVGTVISKGAVVPVIAPAPVYAPPPVYVPAPVYAPVPVVAPVVYGPPVYAPRVVYGPPVWVGGRWVRHPVHRPYPGYRSTPVVWDPGRGHRGPPVRQPGREIRY